jgi:cytochrome c
MIRIAVVVVTTFVTVCALHGAAWAQDAASGKNLFRSQCSLCHSPESGRNLTGPSLFGVVGRAAGTAKGFTYSDAMKNSHLTWNSASLDAFLTAPRQAVPGTFMAFAGIKDPAKRADIIAFLSTLH